MSKLLYKVIALVCAISLATAIPAEAATAVVDRTATITVGVAIAGATSLTVTTCNISNDAVVAPSVFNFGTENAELPPLGNPWVVSGQYLRVQYSSNYGLWGIRIVTDNEDLENDADDTIQRIAALTSGANKYYSGLVILDEADPSMRAPWAWQVFAGKQATVTSPTSAIGADGALTDSGVSGEWNSNWAYIGDKNDTGYRQDVLIDSDSDGSVDDPTYYMVVVGSGAGGGTLTSHPASGSRTGDKDIVVYIAARFANTNYGGAAPVAYLLPADSYSASLYVELVHE